MLCFFTNLSWPIFSHAGCNSVYPVTCNSGTSYERTWTCNGGNWNSGWDWTCAKDPCNPTCDQTQTRYWKNGICYTKGNDSCCYYKTDVPSSGCTACQTENYYYWSGNTCRQKIKTSNCVETDNVVSSSYCCNNGKKDGPELANGCGARGGPCAPCCTIDNDQDGYYALDGICTEAVLMAAEGKKPDCNDQIKTVYPGAPEVMFNDIDDDCNGPNNDKDFLPDRYGPCSGK